MTVNRFARIIPKIAVLFLGIALSNCGKGGGPKVFQNLEQDAPLKLPTQNTPVTIPEDRIVMARDARAECNKGRWASGCSPSVGFVTLVGDDGVINCTGFLIDQNHVVTNGHCVDHAKNILQSGCENKIFIHFPEAHGEIAESVGCSNIDFRARGKTDGTSDFMVLKLNRTLTRTAFVFSDEGLTDNEEVKLFTGVRSYSWDTETKRSGLVGKMGSLKCISDYGSLLLPAVNSSNDEIMTFKKCAIREGNSGSPVINSKGEVTGIIQAIISVKADSELYRDLSSMDRLDEVESMALGTQFPCQKGRLLGIDSDFRCRTVPWLAADSAN